MSEPIRILHILQRMEAGGTQALLMNLYRKIDRTRFQFDFLVVYKEKQFYDKEIKELGGHLYKFSVREDFNLHKFNKELKIFFAEHKEYKIVHCHAYTIGYFCFKAAKNAGIPVRIAHSHSNNINHDYKYIPKLIMQKLFTKNATDLFACSDEAGEYLFKNLSFKVLKNGIDSRLFVADENIRHEMRANLNIENRFVVGHVGRLHQVKNHKFLIDIFEEIKKEKNNAFLLLVGSGPLELQIKKRIAELGLKQDVLFLNNRKDMNRIYQAMDVFVFPSLFEGLGIVALESQAAGIPTICSEGLPQDVAITPLFKQLDLSEGAKKWANESVKASYNPQSHMNMQQYVVNAGFDINNIAQNIQEYYQTLMDGL